MEVLMLAIMRIVFICIVDILLSTGISVVLFFNKEEEGEDIKTQRRRVWLACSAIIGVALLIFGFKFILFVCLLCFIFLGAVLAFLIGYFLKYCINMIFPLSEKVLKCFYYLYAVVATIIVIISSILLIN